MGFLTGLSVTTIFFIVIIIFGVLAMFARFYRKVEQGKALVRNGIGDTRVDFAGTIVIPILHRAELLDISIKQVTIDRRGREGLICKDNMRADIKVAFFVRVNKTEQDVLKVAQSIGCERASHHETLQELFEAKFSEALKTVGKHFDFVDLYISREQFKEQILKVIGTDLNGFVLDDAAIDYLEQTPLDMLNPDNILDSQGIKKITDLTSDEKVLANQINQKREKIITQQNVEAREAILELNRQLAEAESRQKREVDTMKAREEAETQKILHEEKLKSDRARIIAEEETRIAEENKERQITVARKNKERTEAIESERLEKDRMIEATERERVVTLSQIERDKAVEVERKNIQDVIRERVKLERTVVEEQERIKDTEAVAGADREKRVAMIQAERMAQEAELIAVKEAEAARRVAELKAEEDMVRKVKAAEASKTSASFASEQSDIEAATFFRRSEKEAAAKKLMADADAQEKAAQGLSDVRVMNARAEALEKEGAVQAKVLEQKGTAEARVLAMKFQSEAKGIEEKANAIKLMDGVGREHEEFRLRLDKEREIELAEIRMRDTLARHQSEVLGQALRTAKVDIVGGETAFFDRIVGAVTGGKAVDRYVDNSKTLRDVKDTFFNADPAYFQTQFQRFFSQFMVSPEDVKNLTVSAALTRMISRVTDGDERGKIYELLALAERSGMAGQQVQKQLLNRNMDISKTEKE